jgi:hypothetical protein
MEDGSVEDDATGCKVRRQRPREVAPEVVAVGKVRRLDHPDMNQGAVEFVDGGDNRTGQARGAFRDRAEDRQHIGRRTTDHPQDVRRRGLLRERLSDLRVRFRERAILLLQLGEQPHVLNRDHRLVGEGP